MEPGLPPESSYSFLGSGLSNLKYTCIISLHVGNLANTLHHKNSFSAPIAMLRMPVTRRLYVDATKHANAADIKGHL